MLLGKLGNHIAGPISFTPSEIEIVNGWMERVVERKYGSEKYLFGYEQLVYRKLKSAIADMRIEAAGR